MCRRTERICAKPTELPEDSKLDKDEAARTEKPQRNLFSVLRRVNRLKVIHKDFWYGLDDEEDRVLFMYECPNQCLPRRAFFSNGEEWRVKPRLCLKCDTPLDSKADKMDKKIVTTHFYPKCDYKEIEEYELSSKKEESDDLDKDFLPPKNLVESKSVKK